MRISETCTGNQWDAERFYLAVDFKMSMERDFDPTDKKQRQMAEQAVLKKMLKLLIPAGHA